GSEGGAGSNYFVLEAKEVVPEEPNPEVEELRIWKKLVSKEDFPAAVINYSPYTFDRERRVVYILQADQFKLFRYNIDSNTFDSVEITNYPAEATNGGSIIYNPSRNTIQLWRPGPDKVFEVSVEGGPVLQIGTGSFSSRHYGSNPIYNGATNNPLFLFGYGGFRYKNSAFELVNGNWVLRRNDNGDQPYRRGTQVYPNADYTKALIIDGTGNQSGNQFESSCSLPGGAAWASDVGYWCWMRDIWEIDLATMSAREVLPVNSNFGVTGSFGYDYEHNKFYSFGGFRPPSVKWGPIVWEDSLRVFDPSEGVGWKVVSQGGDKRPVNHSTSFYDAEEDRFLVLSADGIYELRIGSDEVPEEEAGCKVVIKSSVEGMSAELCADSTGVVFLDAVLGERDTIYSRYIDSRPDSQFVYVCLDHPMGIDQSALYDLELRDSGGGVSRDTQLLRTEGGDLAVALGVYTNDGGATFSRTYTAGSQKCWELLFFFDGSGTNGYMGSEGGAGSNYFVLEAKEVASEKDTVFFFTDMTVQQGSEVCIPVMVANLPEVYGLQFSIAFDSSQLIFQRVQALNNSLGLFHVFRDQNFGFPGQGAVPHDRMTFLWTAPGAIPRTLPDSTLLFEICFSAIGSGVTSLDFVSDPTSILYIDKNNEHYWDGPAKPGKVTINQPDTIREDDIIIAVEDVSVSPGASFCMDITVTEFTNISALSFGLEFDITKLKFDQVQSLNQMLSISNENGADPFGYPGIGGIPQGRLEFDWSASGLVTFARPTTIFQACFTLLDSIDTEVIFANGPEEVFVGGAEAAPVPFSTKNGIIQVINPSKDSDIIVAM
ncbi:MAG: cohesin domain-containing protein, partial [Saprospiraceae bacterium]|nr:cohesin domain-containing protein [Saprospiraceae bacterium]